ncbi:MAG: serine/threonine-protein kinase [Polyangiaceae bacterium]
MAQDSFSSIGVREGDVVAGKYRIERLLGAGGMGVVVVAHHLQLDERVALKFLQPEALRNAEAVARFSREARAMVKIKSEHVVRVRDVDALPNGAPYMVMEYLEGDDLGAVLERAGVLPIHEAVHFVLQACVAVAEAHAAGIVHRDLKPPNLFRIRGADGARSIKVLDFGISKMVDLGPAAGGHITRDNSPMGTPAYMSPEQVRASSSIDGRADIWALGIILFELLAGRPPFEAECIADVLIKIAIEPTPSLRNVRREVPAELEALIFKCLEKEPEQRFQTVGELARALLPFAPLDTRARFEILSRVPGGAEPQVRVAGASDSVWAGPPPDPAVQPVERGPSSSPPRRSRSLVATGVLSLAAGVAIAATMSWARRPGVGSHRDAQKFANRAALAPEPVQPRAAASPSVPTIDGSDLHPSPSRAADHADALSRAPNEPSSANFMQPSAASAPTSAARPPAPRINCIPPYVLDSTGQHHYKIECL